MATIRARPTTYKGIQMRSRLEALFAQHLDGADWSWQYEPQCFASSDGQYLPDFVSGSAAAPKGRTTYWEVKPSSISTGELSEAWRRMHIILASEAWGELVVVTNTGDHRAPTWQVLKKCSMAYPCLEVWCRRSSRAICLSPGTEADYQPAVLPYGFVLHCPACREAYTHLERVQPDDIGGRLGVRLAFSCECCGGEFSMVIENYKGWSRVDTEREG